MNVMHAVNRINCKRLKIHEFSSRRKAEDFLNTTCLFELWVKYRKLEKMPKLILSIWYVTQVVSILRYKIQAETKSIVLQVKVKFCDGTGTFWKSINYNLTIWNCNLIEIKFNNNKVTYRKNTIGEKRKIKIAAILAKEKRFVVNYLKSHADTIYYLIYVKTVLKRESKV